MRETAITAAVGTKTRPAPVEPPAPVPNVRRKGLVFWLLSPLASLRITVVLFALSLVLVFLGTVAQRNLGIFTVVQHYFRSWGIVWIPYQLFVEVGKVFFDVSEDTQVAGSFPFPGGWLIGTAMGVNLLAAYVVRFRYTWKRLGIVGLHSGILVLMLGELITGLVAVEGNMVILTGGSANYLIHQGTPELAVISHADSREDEVVAVPGSMLRGGGVVRDGQLPFDVKVLRYMVNSTLVPVGKAEEANPSDRGAGRQEVAVEKPEVAGVSTEKAIDFASAYVSFLEKGTDRSLGTYLLSILLEQPQPVTVGGKTYDVALRWKRSYRPYTISLEKFNYEVYPGSSTPKDFSSYIRFVDPTRGEDREMRIWMNHPLRYAGETFYQSGVLGGEGEPVRGTVLQVVRNPGWLLPYLGCFLVAAGMLFQFGVKLTEFLRKSLASVTGPSAARKAPAAGPTGPESWVVPAAVLGLGGLYLVVMMLTPPAGADRFDLQQAAKLPVLDGGRVKPLDSLARTDLMIISGRQEFEDEKDTTQPALRWALDAMSKRYMPEGASPADRLKIFRIDNLEVLNLLGLERRKGFRYAYNEFGDEARMFKVAKELRRVRQLKKEGRELDVYDTKVMELAEHINTYLSLAGWNVAMVPPAPGAGPNDWMTLDDARQAMKLGQGDEPAARAVLDALRAYAAGDAREFNEKVADYYREASPDLPASASTTGLEVFYNEFAPFYRCMYLYVFAFLLACLSWLFWREPLRRAGFWLLLLALVVHTLALVGRMYLMGRWGVFVTNLYSSAIFIGWGCVVLGVVLELIFRIGIGTAVGAVTGFAAVLISHHLALTGDTLEMMRAVLDTNFWLATHVTCVTMGYTATLLAAALAIAYLAVRGIARLADPRLSALPVDVGSGPRLDLFRVLSQMLYGIICFAMLFSFVGTVLGGIWADQSWGRFWGWDPKENGALLIVIWNALILHARWGGLVKQAGVARLAVVGGMITFWSWFGTNQLGVGLHAYGFNDTLAAVCRWVWVALVGILAVEALTLVNWQRLLQRRPPASAA
jgi:ABC-type transport system involved in cytochrome c biogenesis permease subunit